MRKIACIIMLLFSFIASADEVEVTEVPNLEVIQQQQKIESCIVKYVEDQRKSYTRAAQDNLYDMVNNFDRIMSKLRGEKVEVDSTPREEKLLALAKMQCEAYSKLGALK